jgi:hypothetical protein
MVRFLTSYSEWLDTFTNFLNSDLSPKRDIPILLNGYKHTIHGKFIFYNTEQLTRSGKIDQVIKMSKNSNCVEIWDYSKENIEICKKVLIDVLYVPLVSPDTYLNKLREYRSVGQDYDIGFSGELSDRRKYILDSLIDKGYKVNCLKIWGEKRDRELAKCKILLNIHCQDDYKIFESARCEPWLSIGVPIISEHSLDNDDRCINVAYDEIINTSINILKTL